LFYGFKSNLEIDNFSTKCEWDHIPIGVIIKENINNIKTNKNNEQFAKENNTCRKMEMNNDEEINNALFSKNMKKDTNNVFEKEWKIKIKKNIKTDVMKEDIK